MYSLTHNQLMFAGTRSHEKLGSMKVELRREHRFLRVNYSFCSCKGEMVSLQERMSEEGIEGGTNECDLG